MNRSLFHVKVIAQFLGNCSPSWSPLTVRTICTSSPTFGLIQKIKQKSSRILDTSRNVEKEETKEVNQVALSKDGRVIVCWHPEVPFPYEMSKPLPVECIPTESTLKVQALTPVKEVFRKKHPRLMAQELMQLTYTSKYPWLTHKRPRMERYKKLNPLNTERDRDYL